MSESVRNTWALRVSGFCLAAAVLAAVGAVTRVASSDDGNDLLEPFANPTGAVQTISTAGRIDTKNPFFQSLGSNGRSCFSCHRPDAAWSITPASVGERFRRTRGLDPIFRTNDGSVSPFADVSTFEARQAAYAMLLSKGLIRIGLGIPSNAEFRLSAVDDPYSYASSRELSLFRRPLPTTNLTFLSTVMFDGRETFPGKSVTFDLLDQSNIATTGHAQHAWPVGILRKERGERYS